MSETREVTEANIVNMEDEQYETLAQVYLPDDAYDVFFLEVEASVSKNTKCPCLQIKADIVGPDEVITAEDVAVNPVGISLRHAIWYSVPKGDKKGNIAQIRQLHEAFELPLSIDFNNPDPAWFMGKKARVTIKTTEFKQLNAKKEPILDNAGQEIIRYRYEVTNILGPCLDDGDVSFE